jgi:hypothetical protein
MRRGAHFTDNIVRVGLNYHSTHLIAASAKTAAAGRYWPQWVVGALTAKARSRQDL